MEKIYVVEPKRLGKIAPEIYSVFAEHLGGVIYDEIAPEVAADLTGGLKAKIRRLADPMVALEFRKEALITYSGELAPMGSMIEELTYHPERLEESVIRFDEDYRRLIGILDRQSMREENRFWLLQAIDWNDR